MPIIPKLRKLTQKDCKLEASLPYSKTLPKKKKKNLEILSSISLNKTDTPESCFVFYLWFQYVYYQRST
jgi:hypothetical protein